MPPISSRFGRYWEALPERLREGNHPFGASGRGGLFGAAGIGETCDRRTVRGQRPAHNGGRAGSGPGSSAVSLNPLSNPWCDSQPMAL